MMTSRRDEILRRLSENRQQLTQFGVRSLSLFGSVARDDASQDSDVDILVEFTEPVGIFEFIRLKTFLEELLKQSVDLVTPDAIKRQLRDTILEEAIHAA